MNFPPQTITNTLSILEQSSISRPSTNSSTSLCDQHQISDLLSLKQPQNNDRFNEEFLIDVRPKKKFFANGEERKNFVQNYKRKFKTELCKNFQLTGKCRYGDTCCFAHGEHELKIKSHLHINYKTRPCQQFFDKGYCYYGNRCQYIHSELKYVTEFKDFLIDNYDLHQMKLNKARNLELDSDILVRLSQVFMNCQTLEEFFAMSYALNGNKRLSCFLGITEGKLNSQL